MDIEKCTSIKYAHANNKRLLVKNGDNVNTGQNISISGKSGGRSVNGVYFELRK